MTFLRPKWRRQIEQLSGKSIPASETSPFLENRTIYRNLYDWEYRNSSVKRWLSMLGGGRGLTEGLSRLSSATFAFLNSFEQIIGLHHTYPARTSEQFDRKLQCLPLYCSLLRSCCITKCNRKSLLFSSSHMSLSKTSKEPLEAVCFISLY